jgi:hypothetical protein
MIIVDFSEYLTDNEHSWFPVEPEELRAVGAGAQRMIERYTDATCELMLVGWEIELMRRARDMQDAVDEDWFVRALLCIALRGYRGDSAPRFCENTEFR